MTLFFSKCMIFWKYAFMKSKKINMQEKVKNEQFAQFRLNAFEKIWFVLSRMGTIFLHLKKIKQGVLLTSIFWLFRPSGLSLQFICIIITPAILILIEKSYRKTNNTKSLALSGNGPFLTVKYSKTECTQFITMIDVLYMRSVNVSIRY